MILFFLHFWSYFDSNCSITSTFFCKQGGFKLQVLDALQRPSMDLTPVTKESDFLKTDVT